MMGNENNKRYVVEQTGFEMATRRNNMFYYRGACAAYSTILQIIKEIKSDEERMAMLERLHKSWLNGARAIALNQDEPKIDSCTIFTEHFYVTITNGKYTVVDNAINGESFERMILWNEHTKTNIIIDFTGDWDSIINFIDNDPEFMVNLTNVLGLNPDEVDVIDSPKVIYVIEDHGDSFYD